MKDQKLYIVKTLHGLEDILSKELIALGANEVTKGVRMVQFKGDLEMVYKANLWLRTGLRILQPIKSFKAKTYEELYKKVQSINWENYMGLRDTFAVDSVVKSPVFRHSKYAALKTKDAIADQFRKKKGRRPSVNVDTPNLRLHLHINNTECALSIDSSGGSLHKRGYRMEMGKAPLNEVLAAGMVMMSGWDKQQPLVDPFCGSGTILIEAGMIARNIAPNRSRTHFGFMKWRNFNRRLWKKVKDEATAAEVKHNCELLGYDISSEVLVDARRNAMLAKIAQHIRFQSKPLHKCFPPEGGGFIITNPPYGLKVDAVGAPSGIDDFYTMFGSHLKKHAKDYTVWILSGNMDALKKIGLESSRRIVLFNGPMECRFCKYEMYEGKREDREKKDDLIIT